MSFNAIANERFHEYIPSRQSNKCKSADYEGAKEIWKLWDICKYDSISNKTIIWQTRWNCDKIHLANKEFSYLLKYQVPVDSEGFKIMRHLRDNATCSFVEKIFKLWDTSPQKFKIMWHPVALRNLKLWDMRSSIFVTKNERPFFGMDKKNVKIKQN